MADKMIGSRKTHVVIGGSLEDELDRFVDVWERAEAGERLPEAEQVVVFESLEAFLRVMSPERLKLLKRLAQHPTESLAALSRAVDRAYSRVHADIVLLQEAGLVVREGTALRAAGHKLVVETDLLH